MPALNLGLLLDVDNMFHLICTEFIVPITFSQEEKLPVSYSHNFPLSLYIYNYITSLCISQHFVPKSNMYYSVVKLQPNFDKRYVLMYCRIFFTLSVASEHVIWLSCVSAHLLRLS